MTTARDKILLVKGEAESVFGTENGAHSFFDIETVDAQWAPAIQTFDEEVNKQRITQAQDIVLGRYTGKLTFGTLLVGDGTALEAGATATDDSHQGLLKHALGGSYADEGSETTGTPTTTVVAVSPGDGSLFRPGQAIAVEDSDADGTGYAVSVIESISTDELTLAWALPSAPAASKKVVAGYTAYLDPDVVETWQFQWISDGSSDVYMALGCAGSFAFENLLGVSGVPRLKWDFSAAKWASDTATLAAGSFDGAAPIPTNTQLELLLGAHGTSTRSKISSSMLDVSPGVSWEPHYARGNDDTEHMQEWVRKYDPATLKLKIDRDVSYVPIFAVQTALRFLAVYGTTPGKITVIDMPNVKLSEMPANGAHAGLQAHDLTFRAYEDDAGDASTAIMRSPIRISRI